MEKEVRRGLAACHLKRGCLLPCRSIVAWRAEGCLASLKVVVVARKGDGGESEARSPSQCQCPYLPSPIELPPPHFHHIYLGQNGRRKARASGRGVSDDDGDDAVIGEGDRLFRGEVLPLRPRPVLPQRKLTATARRGVGRAGESRADDGPGGREGLARNCSIAAKLRPRLVCSGSLSACCGVGATFQGIP